MKTLCKDDGCIEKATVAGQCQRHYSSGRYQLNREKILARTREYHERNREWYREYYKQYYGERKTKYKERSYSWRMANPVRAAEINRKNLSAGHKRNPQRRATHSKQWRIKHGKEYRIKNLDKIRAQDAAVARRRRKLKLVVPRKDQSLQSSFRRAAKQNASPQWLTKAQRAEIKRIYQNCPAGHHVDHIVPLRGRTVSGLHVPWNLQYLPAQENLKKGNKLMVGV